MLAKLIAWWTALSPQEVLWLFVGLVGQAMFSARWLIQWFITEKSRRSTMPDTFWYFSLVGGLLVFAYGLHRLDPAILLGQFGIIIYARNLFFIRREKQAGSSAATAPAPAGN